MHFATPLFLLGLLALGVHLALYCLRTRHPPRPVSSLMLWRGATRTSSEGRSLRIPRLPPLFFLEMLALAALAIAAATPFFRRGGSPAPTVVLDPSLSMSARASNGETFHNRAADALRRELRHGRPPFVRLIAADPDAPRLVGLLSPDEAVAYVRDPAHFTAGSDTLPGALRLADRLRAPGSPILCLTDHDIPGLDLPAETRLLAFGEPLPNASIAYASRAPSEAGADALLVRVRCSPAVSTPPVLSLSANGESPTIGGVHPDPVPRASGPREDFTYRAVLPPGTGTISLSLPADALAADNTLELDAPDLPTVPIALDLSDPALSNCVVRAVRATGLGALRPVTVWPGEPGSLLVTDRATVPPPPHDLSILHLVPPGDGRRLSAAPPLVETDHPLLEGLDFSGLAWSVGDTPLPGRPLVSSGITPVLSLERPDAALPASALHLRATATDPFFRSPAWPSLVWNLLHRIALDHAAVPPQVHHGTRESDLSACASATRAGPAAPLSAENSVSLLPTSLAALLVFGLLAARLLLVRGRPAPRRRLHATLLALSFAALLAATFRPGIPLPQKAGVVIAVADRSASLPAAEHEAQTALLESISRHRPDGEFLGVVSFGAAPAIEQIPSESPFTGFAADIDPEGSDLAGALRLAAGLVPPGSPARIVVLSDGRAPDLGVSDSRTFGLSLPVDFRYQGAPPPEYPALLRVDAPLRLRPDEGLLATAWVLSPKSGPVRYRFRCGTNLVASGTCDLPEGVSHLSFRDAPRPAGTASYTLSIASATDDAPVSPPARFLVTRESDRPLLVVPASPASRLPGLLASSGVVVERVDDPALFDFSPATLSGHSGLLIENVPASAFGHHALSNIAAWVSQAGGGLALTGGRNAFGLGGYYKSPLEPVLPVSLEVRDEHRKFSMAVAIALDRSGSMAASAGGGRTKMDLADIGAAEVLDLLSDSDEIAVFAVDSEPHEVVPLVPAPEARKRRNSILGIRSQGGGIYVYRALAAAIEALKESRSAIRHVILFADASDAEAPEDYTTLVGLAQDLGITVSVIGLGAPSDCDADLLRDIASIGNGECFFSANADELPRLFAQDTILLSRNALVEEPTEWRATTALPLFSDTLPASLPPLGGYNLCYAHPAATVAAVSADENAAPLLAFRPVGAGRTLAFTGEADGALSGPFATGPHVAEFYAAIARRIAAPDASLPPGAVLVPRLSGTSLDIDLYADPAAVPALTPPPLLRLLRTRPSGTDSETVSLAWTAPDRLSVSIPLAASETVLPVLLLPDGPRPLPPARLSLSPESVPDPDNRGEANLVAIAKATGGRRLVDPAEVWKLLRHGSRPFALAPPLYILASLLLLLDILLLRLGRAPAPVVQKPVTSPSGSARTRHRPSRKPKNPAGSAEPPAEETPSASETPPPSLLSQAKTRAKRKL